MIIEQHFNYYLIGITTIIDKDLRIMNVKTKLLNTALTGLLLSASCIVSVANAGVIHWADWQSGTSTEVLGEFVTNTSSVGITYTNNQEIAFLQTGSRTDYFDNHQSSLLSPYTSTEVDNIPTASEMIALENSGNQTLAFSESVANIVFSYVSLNGNGYSFDQDFDILSVGGVDGKSDGHYGGGTSYKNIVDNGDGTFDYQLLGTGEPHGTIQFKGAFDEVSWNSLSNEYWNGFTVGIQGTTAEVVNSIPEPTTLAIFALGMFGLAKRRYPKKA